MILLRTTVLLSLLAAPAVAQTFVVDINNGPGTDFTQIAAAVPAVPDGAVLEVRPGTYSQFQVRAKSLTVIGEAGVMIRPPTFQTVAIDIADLAAHQSVALRYLELASFFGPPSINLRDSSGTIVVDRCSGVVGPLSQVGGQLVIANCDRAFVRDSAFTTSAFFTGPINAFLSNVFISGCDLRSTAFCIRQGGGRVQVTASRLEPQNASPAFAPALLFLAGGELVVHGDCVLSGLPSLQIQLAAGTGTFVLASDTVLQNFPANPIDPNITLVNRDVSRLDATTQGLGGLADGVLVVPTNAMGFLFVGIPDGPTALPLIAEPWFVASCILQAAGGAPLVSGGYTVPNAPWVVGVQIAWQGIVVDGGSAVASNPVVYVHH